MVSAAALFSTLLAIWKPILPTEEDLRRSLDEINLELQTSDFEVEKDVTYEANPPDELFVATYAEQLAERLT